MKILPAFSAAILLLLCLTSQADDASHFLSPKEYSDLHILALNTKDPQWAAAIDRLGKSGDGFTLEHLQTLDSHKLAPRQADLLKATISTLGARVAKEDPSSFAKSIQMHLERAAWADLSCNPLETSLVPWTIATIKKHLDTPEVVAELKRIQSQYVPSVDMKTLFSTMRERVPSYANRILGPK